MKRRWDISCPSGKARPGGTPRAHHSFPPSFCAFCASLRLKHLVLILCAPRDECAKSGPPEPGRIKRIWPQRGTKGAKRMEDRNGADAAHRLAVELDR